jgi:hypothetical protein
MDVILYFGGTMLAAIPFTALLGRTGSLDS